MGIEALISKLVGKYSFVLIILFASITRVSVTAQAARAESGEFKGIDVFLSMVVTLFSGTLFWAGAMALELGYYQTLVVSGMGAYAGVTGINMLIDWFAGFLKRGQS